MKAFADHLPPLLIGAAAFMLVTGGAILDPTFVDWLMRGGDAAQHWLGWQFFRQSPIFQWPLGANPGYGMEIGSSIVFSDSIPLLALFFKPFDAILPDTFQYFGLWILGCFLLQSVFAWKLLGLFTANRSLRLLGCAFFLIAPAWLFRIRGHHALFAQWTLLAALLLYFSAQFSHRRWTGLLSVTALIHAYLLAMVLAIYLADLVQRGWLRRLSITDAVRGALVAGLSVIAVMWAAGYFMLGTDTVPDGFGFYRMNLLSPFDPDATWSALLPNQNGGAGDYEGFNFLGSGMLALTLVAVFVTAVSKGPSGSGDMLPRMAPILAVSLLLLLFAISNRVAIGGHEILSYPSPGPLGHLADTFRSSGRFFWPLYYLGYLAIFYLLFTRIAAKPAAAICIVALLLQTVDSSAAGERIRTRFAQAPQWSSPLRSAMWDELATRYRKVVVVLPHNASPGWAALSRYAADHAMTINTGYFARVDRDREQHARRHLAISIMNNALDTDALYVFQDDGLWELALSQQRAADVAGMLDGYRIVAPQLRECAECDLNAITVAAVDTDQGYRHERGPVVFTTAGRGHQHTIYGWSLTEQWVW